MANSVYSTCSNGPKVKASVQDVLVRWWFGFEDYDESVTAEIQKDREGVDRLCICGYDYPSPRRLPAKYFELDEDARHELLCDLRFEVDLDLYGFLEEIAPHLEEPLEIQVVGFEKCRYPHLAQSWRVSYKDGRAQVTCRALDDER